MDLATWNSLQPGDQVRHYRTDDVVWVVDQWWTKEHVRFVTSARGPRVPAPGTLVTNEHRDVTLICRAKENRDAPQLSP